MHTHILHHPYRHTHYSTTHNTTQKCMYHTNFTHAHTQTHQPQAHTYLCPLYTDISPYQLYMHMYTHYHEHIEVHHTSYIHLCPNSLPYPEILTYKDMFHTQLFWSTELNLPYYSVSASDRWPVCSWPWCSTFSREAWMIWRITSSRISQRKIYSRLGLLTAPFHIWLISFLENAAWSSQQRAQNPGPGAWFTQTALPCCWETDMCLLSDTNNRWHWFWLLRPYERQWCSSSPVVRKAAPSGLPPLPQVPLVSPLCWATLTGLKDSVRQTLSTEGHCSPVQGTTASGSPHEKGQMGRFCTPPQGIA